VKRLLITGANGQLGSRIQGLWKTGYEVLCPDRQVLDLSRPEKIGPWIKANRPDLIFNCAAYTAVDKAEAEAELAHLINTNAPAELAKAAKALKIPLIHYSTDYVFDGTKPGPYLESDPTAPLNQYGRSKALGEEAVLAEGDLVYILRVSWLYSRSHPCFYQTMVRLLKERDELKVVNDQIGAPTAAGWAAFESGILAEKLLSWDLERSKTHRGIYHLSASGQISWYEFAQEILKSLNLVGQVDCNISPIPADQYPLPAKRPQNSILSNQKRALIFGRPQMDWRTQFYAEVGSQLRQT